MVVENKGIISHIKKLKEDLAVFKITPDKGKVPDFKPGQFLTLSLHFPGEKKPVRRAYSIVSPPEQKEYFELYIRWVRKPVPGKFTTELFKKKEGDEILWIKPAGAFTIENKKPNGELDNRRMILIGGGTGIAPFISYVLHLNRTGSKREIILLHGASYVNELGYRALLTSLEQESIKKGGYKWNFRYRASISRPEEWINRGWDGHKGRVETFLKPALDKSGLSALEELVGEKITPKNTMFYVCGWQGTIDAVLTYLIPKGFVTRKNKRADGTYDIKYESYG